MCGETVSSLIDAYVASCSYQAMTTQMADLWTHLVLQVTVLGRGCAIGRALSCTTCSRSWLSKVPASTIQVALP